MQAVAIPHYSVIANVIQMVSHNKLDDPDYKNEYMAPGDVAVAGMFGVLPICILLICRFVAQFSPSSVSHYKTFFCISLMLLAM